MFPHLRHQQQPFLDERRSFAVEDIRVDTQLLDQAKAAGYSTKVLFISTEDANLNVGRVLVRMSRGGQAVPVSSVIDSYRESTKSLSEVPKHADELLVYDNTAHRRGFRVVAHFIGGKLSKTAQTMPDWAAKVFGKELHAAKQHEKPGAWTLTFVLNSLCALCPDSLFPLLRDQSPACAQGYSDACGSNRVESRNWRNKGIPICRPRTLMRNCECATA